MNKSTTLLTLVHVYFLLFPNNAYAKLKKIPFPSQSLSRKDVAKHDKENVLKHFSLRDSENDTSWIYFRTKSTPAILTRKKKSTFFNFALHKLAQSFDKIALDDNSLAVIYGAFSDYDKKVSPLDVCYFSYKIDTKEMQEKITNPFHYVLPNRDFIYNVDYEQWKKTDFEKLKKEALSVMAYRYKIHLQVKPEYLISFILDFAKMLHEKKLYDVVLEKLIPGFKITKSYRTGIHIPNKTETITEAVPTVVLYPALIPGSKKTKQRVLSDLFKKITNHYKNEISTISLDVKPRFNRKVNDLVWVSGGCSCHKYYYKKFLKKYNIPNTIFTDDFAFIRGYEYK